jgi:hypothetical protein
MDELIAAQLIRNPRYLIYQSTVANLLRRIEEIQHGLHVPQLPYDEVFAFCPICGTPLVGCPPWDSWCAGLRCRNDHQFDYRGCLTYIEKKRPPRLSLCPELSDEIVAQYCGSVIDKTLWSPWSEVPKDALRVINEFLRESKKAK